MPLNALLQLSYIVWSHHRAMPRGGGTAQGWEDKVGSSSLLSTRRGSLEIMGNKASTATTGSQPNQILGRIVSAGGRQLLQELNLARRNFLMKIFLLLLGFYTANALATILGQTGDWDVLVAGVVVAAIEGIGMLMYLNPASVAVSRLQSFVTMINFWKAGVILGVFVDAFKLGS